MNKKMARGIKILVMVSMLMLFSTSIFGYDMYFTIDDEKVDETIIYSDKNVFIFNLHIDNSNPADYVSDSSELSYLNVKAVGENENLVTLVNRRDFENTGLFIDKDVKENLEVELRLPVTEKWKSEYVIQVAGIAPDKRQEIATLTVKPQGEKVGSFTDDISLKTLFIWIGGALLLILFIYLADKFNLVSKLFGGKKKW